MKTPVSLALAAVIVLLPASSPWVSAAEEPGELDTKRQHYEAQQALKSGLVRPLDDILTEIRKKFPGDIIEIEFEKEDGRYLYEIEIIKPDGQMIEVEVDAKTMEVLSVDDDDAAPAD
jgi:uncharacterized membrane protein YkoI